MDRNALNSNIAKTTFKLCISLFSITVVLYIGFRILNNLVTIYRKYNIDDVKNKSKQSLFITDKTKTDNYDYSHNKTDKLSNINLNDQILQRIEVQNDQQQSDLQNIINYRKKFNLSDTLNSSITNQILGPDKDDLSYNSGSSNFWLKLLQKK